VQGSFLYQKTPEGVFIDADFFSTELALQQL
jgi:hypothetical protein